MRSSILATKLRVLFQRIVEVINFHFSATPSLVIIWKMSQLHYMFFPLYVYLANARAELYSVVTLPWIFLLDTPDPYGRGTMDYLVYPYSPLFHQKSVWNIIEIALMLFGACLFLWSFVMWVKNRDKLIKNGLYKVIRHPQYLGIIVAVLGLSLMATAPIALISWGAMAYAYILMGLFEERSLTNKFGDKYTSYKDKTWFMLPFPKIVKGKFGCIKTAILATLALIAYEMIVVYVSYYIVYIPPPPPIPYG